MLLHIGCHQFYDGKSHLGLTADKWLWLNRPQFGHLVVGTKFVPTNNRSICPIQPFYTFIDRIYHQQHIRPNLGIVESHTILFTFQTRKVSTSSILSTPHFKCDLFLRFQIEELLHHDNIICLPGEPGDVLSPNPRPRRKAVGIMSTYEEFMVLLTMGLLIVAILNLKNKK